MENSLRSMGHKLYQELRSGTVLMPVIAIIGLIVAFMAHRPYLQEPPPPVILGDADMTPHWDTCSVYYFQGLSLDRGYYTIRVDYESDADLQVMLKETNDAASAEIRGTPVSLSKAFRSHAFRVWIETAGDCFLEINEAVPHDRYTPRTFDIRIDYRPRMTASYIAFRALLPFLLILLPVAVIRFFSRKNEPASARVFFVLAVLCVLVSFPVFSDVIVSTNDVGFHMKRIAFLGDALTDNAIQFRILPGFYANYGYPVGMFYGELMMIPAAVLYKCGIPLYQCFQFFLVYTNALTVFIAYHCFRRLSGNRMAGLVVTILYACATWRLQRAYYTAAIGEFSAMAFLPLLVLGAYELFSGSERDSIRYLVAGYTGLLQTHAITTVLASFFLFVLCVIEWRALFLKRKIITLLVAAGAAILVNLWFLVPFLDYYLRYDLVIENARFGAAFRSTIPELLTDRTGIAVALLILLSVVLMIGEKQHEKKRAAGAFLGFTILCLFMASVYMPWEWLQKYLPPLYSLLGEKTQHAFRYCTIATPLACSMGAFCLRDFENRNAAGWLKPLIVCLALFACTESLDYMTAAVNLPATSDYPTETLIDPAGALQYENRDKMESGGIVNNPLEPGDDFYLYSEIDTSAFHAPEPVETNIVCGEGCVVEETRRRGMSFTFYAENRTDAESWAECPVWLFAGYRAKGINGALPVISGTNCKVRVLIPAGYSGQIRVSFDGMWYWHAAELVSVLFVLLLLWIRRHPSTIDPMTFLSQSRSV